MRRFLIATLVCCQVMTGGCAAVVTAAAAHGAAIATAVEVVPVVLAAGAIGVLGVMGAAKNTPDSFADGSLGAFLQASDKEATRLAETGMQTRHEALMTAGLQVHNALARAQLAYDDSLSLKLADLPGPERLFVARTGEMLAGLSSGQGRAIKEAGDRANAVGARLDVPEGAPQILTAGPVYLFAFLPFQTVSIRGKFPAAYENGAVPRLTVNKKTYTAYSYSTQSLDFAIVAGDLRSETEDISWVKGELVVPWDKPLFGPLRRSGVETVVIGVLPDSLGRATVEHVSGTARAASESFDLRWGERRTFAYPAGQWKLRYSLFNRDSTEVDRADAVSPFIRVASDGHSMTIRTFPF